MIPRVTLCRSESTVGRGTFVRRERAEVEQVAVALGAPVEQLLHFDAGRPRYPAVDGAVSLNSLVPEASLYPVKEFRREGALRVRGKTIDYYRTFAGSFGLQLGAQSKSIVIAFMTKESLNKFLNSEGWKIGVDGSADTFGLTCKRV